MTSLALRGVRVWSSQLNLFDTVIHNFLVNSNNIQVVAFMGFDTVHTFTRLKR
jgi:hypothetical protein